LYGFVIWPFILREEHRVMVGFEVLTAVVLKSTIFWDITPCSPLRINRPLGGAYSLSLQGRKILPPALTLVSCLAYFRPWRWRRYVLPKLRWLSTDYMVLYPRSWYSSTVDIDHFVIQTVYRCLATKLGRHKPLCALYLLWSPSRYWVESTQERKRGGWGVHERISDSHIFSCM
jgi:hypothetical protein